MKKRKHPRCASIRKLDARVLGHITGGDAMSPVTPAFTQTGIATSPGTTITSAGTPQNSPVTKPFAQ